MTKEETASEEHRFERNMSVICKVILDFDAHAIEAIGKSVIVNPPPVLRGSLQIRMIKAYNKLTRPIPDLDRYFDPTAISARVEQERDSLARHTDLLYKTVALLENLERIGDIAAASPAGAMRPQQVEQRIALRL